MGWNVDNNQVLSDCKISVIERNNQLYSELEKTCKFDYFRTSCIWSVFQRDVSNDVPEIIDWNYVDLCSLISFVSYELPLIHTQFIPNFISYKVIQCKTRFDRRHIYLFTVFWWLCADWKFLWLRITKMR